MLKEWLQGALGRVRRNSDVERKLGPYLADGRACKLLRLVLENPGVTVMSLAMRAKLDMDTVAVFLKRLTEDGLIVAEKEDGEAGYHIAMGAKAAVTEHLPLNYQCPGMLRE